MNNALLFQKRVIYLCSFLWLCFISLPFSLFAQTKVNNPEPPISCGTPTPSPEVIRSTEQKILELKKSWVRTQALPSLVQIPIKAHIIRSSSGSGGLSISTLNTAIATMNTIYLPMNMQFYLCGGVHYIDNDQWFNTFDQAEDAKLALNNVNDAINLYCVPNLTSGSQGLNGYAGYPNSSASSNRIVMSNAATNNGTTFAHEMGHYWNLYHTHETGPGSELVTRGVGANCTTAGDLLCDTPADIYGYFYNQTTCTYTGTGVDANGQFYTPDLRNLMSYYHACRNQFTDGQYNRMSDGYNYRLNLMQLAGQYNFNCISSVNAATNVSVGTSASCGVTVSWTDVANNESGYIIERSSSPNSNFLAVGKVAANITSFSDIIPSGAGAVYYYRVISANSNGVTSNVVSYTSTTCIGYCIPSSTNCSDNDVITNLTLGTLNNNSGCSSGGYADYTSTVTAPTLQKSSAYSFSITKPTNYAEGIQVWIDYNKNGAFEGSEKVVEFNINSTATQSATITIPSTATTGVTLMRVRLSYNALPGDPCITTETFGETEDYAINITGAVSCSATISGTTAYCTGQTISLTASGGSSYLWSGPNTFSSTSATVSRAASTTNAGVYSVTVASGTCTISTSVSVAVNTTPTASISGTTTYCTGQTISLTASGGSSYTWSGQSGFSTTSATVSIPSASTAAGGIYVVTAANGSCTSTASVSIVVNTTPSVTASSNSPVCVGSSITLTATGTGTTYSWSGPNVFSTTGATPTITNATTTMSGNYTVTAVNGSCTASASTSVSVSVCVPTCSVTAIISGTTAYCTGQTIALTASGGTNYAWSGPNVFSSTSATVSRTASTTNAGVYSVTVASGTCTISTSVSLVVNPTPTASISGTTTYCEGQTISLTASGGSSYSWSGPSGFTMTTASISRAGATTSMAGAYSVTAANGTCTGTASVSVVVNPAPSVTASSNSPVCVGSSITLTATGTGTTYSWSGPNVFSTTGATPTITNATTAMSGNYTVTAANGSCTASAITSVSVSVCVPTCSVTAIISGATAYCTGQTISLTASGGSSYSWSGPNSFSSTSATVSRSASTANAGVYSVTVGSGTCTISTSVSVAVTATPTASISGTTTYCSGQTIGLTASGGSSYTWSGPGGFSATTAIMSLGATTTAAGVYSVIVSQNNCTASATTSVSVQPAAATLTASSNAPICTGTALNLSANIGTTTGGSFSWSGPLNFSSTAKNPTISSAQTTRTGIYSVTYQKTGLCSVSATTSVIVGVQPTTPTISTSSGKNVVCTGLFLVLTIPTQSGMTYQWTLNSTVVGTANSLTITAAGSYTAKVVSPGGCQATKTLAITAATTPSVTATNTVTASKITLKANPSGLKYTWSGPASFSSTVRNPTILNPKATHAGIYTLQGLVATSGCSATATTAVVVGSPATRIAQKEDKFIEISPDLFVYPNPTHGNITVEIKLSKAEAISLQITDMAGNTKETWELAEEKQEHRKELDLSAYPDGSYVIRGITKEGKQVFKKVVKIE